MKDTSPRQYIEKVPQAIQDLLYDGQKIAAIKLARERMGWGLKEAKEKVEAVEAEMRTRFPGALPERRNVGCGAAVVACALIGAVIALAAVAILR